MTFVTRVQVGEKDKNEEEVNCIPAAKTLLSWYLLIDVVLLPHHLPWTALLMASGSFLLSFQQGLNREWFTRWFLCTSPVSNRDIQNVPELHNAARNVTTWRTGLNIEHKTFIRPIAYQNKVVHPSQATAASPMSRRHCLLFYSSLLFNCTKQTNKKSTLEQLALLVRADSGVWSTPPQGLIPGLPGSTSTLCFSSSEEESCRHHQEEFHQEGGLS